MSRNKNIAILSAVVLLALSLRLYGINFGLPYLYHADEPIVVNHAMAYGLGDLNPHFFAIPPLVSYILFIIYGLYFLIGRVFHLFVSPDDFAMAFLNDPSIFYLLGRIFIGALMGAATVLIMYLFGKKLFSPRVGLISALFTAVAFIHVQNSHYIYADIPMVFFIVLACISALNIIHTGGIKDYIFAGIFAGLATAFKYNAAVIFIVIAAAHFINYGKRYPARLAASFIVMAGTFIICNPFSMLDMPNFVKGIVRQSGAEYSLGIFHHLSYSLAEGLGPVLVIFGILGILYFAIRYPKAHLAFISFPVVFYIILSFFSQAHERYVLPLVPFFIVYAAAFIEKIIKKKLFILIVIAAVVIPNFSKSLYSDYLFSREDTRTLAAGWIEANIKSNSRIAIEHSFFCPRLNQAREQIEEKLTYGLDDSAKNKRIELALGLADKIASHYYLYYLKEEPVVNTGFLFERPQIAFSIPDLRDNGIEYIVMHIDTEKNMRMDFYKELIDNAVLIKEFSPYRNKDTRYARDLTVQTGGPFLGRELFARCRNGYMIKIFKLKRT